MAEASALEQPLAASNGQHGLVERARRGDLAAFEALIGPRSERLLRLALSICRDEPDARDAIQEAFLRSWRDLPRLRDPSRFDAWLSRIVVNACRTTMRKRRRSSAREIRVDSMAVGLEPATPGPADSLTRNDAIARAFARLDPDRRAILALHYVDHRSVADIAGALGIPEGTAKWRLHAARNDLARAIEHEEGEA